MRMNFYQFNLYPQNKRAGLVWQHGRFLAIRTEMGCSLELYHMGEFPAEVWYSPTQNRIKLVRRFRGRIDLEPYLKMIDLAWLMGEEQ